MLTQQERILTLVREHAPMNAAQIVTEEIRIFKQSDVYKDMLLADEYWRNRSDVQTKTTGIQSRSNTRIEHPILRKLVNQKINYLLSNPFAIASEDKRYSDALNEIFNDTTRSNITRLTQNAIKYGIGYLQPYITEGKLQWAKLPPYEVIPFWTNTEHTDINGFIRFYSQDTYEATKFRKIERAELWTTAGVQYFISADNINFYPDPEKETVMQLTIGDIPYNWTRPPLIWLKYNDDELPLVYFVKDLIDDLNWQKSITSDVLRDIVNFVYVLRNYGGQDLDEFIQGIQKHFAIQVEDDGGVDKLAADLSIEAVMSYMDMTRRDLYNYGSGVDTDDPDLGNASGVAINFRYMDLDADCRALGQNLKETLEAAKFFIDTYLQMTNKGAFATSTFQVTYATELPVNETEVIENCCKSVGLISMQTILENHPWVENPEDEMRRLEEEQEKDAPAYPAIKDDEE